MNDLVEWLLVQIAEDERQAREFNYTYTVPCPYGHPARRVLAECAAKRQIIRAHNAHCDGTCGTGKPSAAYPQHQAYYWTMTVHALPYADRPGYREEWRP